ncbi:MAG: hypothetical protein HFI43_03380 [Lachnospiraceae bacterium]|jgi:hypothetical protein|nr:hypothetical protein [Lachnospiraceae bacterium]GFI18740.1 hypothetical protein IMSAGC009_03917 [Lachnospiraceae bacterium]
MYRGLDFYQKKTAKQIKNGTAFSLMEELAKLKQEMGDSAYMSDGKGIR